MKKLQILRVDNDVVQKMDLQIGNNIIGRNVETGCDDDRIIKYAAIINLTSDNEMTITPVAPCYMKSIESSRWQLLKLGVAVPVKPGDVCTLVPDKCWFKIISVPDKMENNEDYTLKRKVNEDLDSNSVRDKRLCSGEGDNSRSSCNALHKILNNDHNVNKVNVEESVTNEDNITYNNNENKAQDANSTLICDYHNIDQSSAIERSAYEVQNMNKENSESYVNEKTLSLKKNLDLPSISEDHEKVVVEDIQSPVSKNVHRSKISANATGNVFRRDKCRYGEECYRKNSQHRDKFCHPEDSDYDIPDNREECPYGTRCYRKNPQHKMKFKHIGTNIANNKRKKQNSKQTQIQKSLDTISGMEDSSVEESAEESVDESEYEPSSNDESSDDDEMYSDKN
ncbi:aprataxin and PNK-like factor isoform X2 [Bombus terrestris]|uniref:Aprataxin and PNK-like factor isoform X2 n=1 Tax=Bombus terrestris TaxID=30195 RepID=A0A9C6W3H2_BOMTE|nr:aprataxin and PNK-like factor isoform X2 [Bombus terrestris]